MSEENQNADAQRDRLWQAFGDTITAPRDGVRSYVDLARDEKDALGLADVVNCADAGWTSVDLKAEVEAKLAQVRPQVVSVMIGASDHVVEPGATEPRVGLESFDANVRAALRSILDWEGLGRRKDGGPCLIVLTPPFCMTGANRAGLGLAQERLVSYCAALLRLAEEAGAITVDVNTILGTSVRWSEDRLKRVWTEDGDGLHMNSLAHKLIYPYVRGALRHCLC